jgi:hypothetical protein
VKKAIGSPPANPPAVVAPASERSRPKPSFLQARFEQSRAFLLRFRLAFDQIHNGKGRLILSFTSRLRPGAHRWNGSLHSGEQELVVRHSLPANRMTTPLVLGQFVKQFEARSAKPEKEGGDGQSADSLGQSDRTGWNDAWPSDSSDAVAGFGKV